jgi:hypothetical protein
LEKLKRDKTMRRARGKTANRGKNPENYSTSLKMLIWATGLRAKATQAA